MSDAAKPRSLNLIACTKNRQNIGHKYNNLHIRTSSITNFYDWSLNWLLNWFMWKSVITAAFENTTIFKLLGAFNEHFVNYVQVSTTVLILIYYSGKRFTPSYKTSMCIAFSLYSNSSTFCLTLCKFTSIVYWLPKCT